MENTRVLIATDEKTLKDVLNEMFEKKSNIIPPLMEEDKISKAKACKLIGCTPPTLNKLIEQGKFKQHSLSTKRYFLRSEIIEALRK
jgi:hypothetical protein